MGPVRSRFFAHRSARVLLCLPKPAAKLFAWKTLPLSLTPARTCGENLSKYKKTMKVQRGGYPCSRDLSSPVYTGCVPRTNPLTERLYYDNPALLEFDATVTAVENRGEQGVVSLDRTAFYPTSGGQNFDTGEIYAISNGSRIRVIDVQEQEQTGEVLHVIDCPPGWLRAEVPVKGEVDSVRRRDDMQQHSGQHVLSAAFERLYGFATVSFHMEIGRASCRER